MRDLDRRMGRARKLCNRLRAEVRKCLIEKRVTEAAGALAGEVVGEASGILDAAMFQLWRGYAARHPGTREPEAGARFPAAASEGAFAAALESWGLGGAAQAEPALVGAIRRWQPFVSDDNLWLARLDALSRLPKLHVVPQIRVEQVPSRGGPAGLYGFHPALVRLRGSRWGMGGYGQPMTPHARWATGMPARRETWVALTLAELDMNALAFCQTTLERVGRVLDGLGAAHALEEA